MFTSSDITPTPETDWPSRDRDAVYFDVAGDYSRTMRCWVPPGQGPTPERVAAALNVLARQGQRVVEGWMLGVGGLEVNLSG